MLWRGQQLKTIGLLVFFLSGLFLTVDLLTVVSDRIARAFVFLGLLELQHLGLYFTNPTVVEFQVGYLALFHHFMVIDSFKWFWMGSLFENN